MSDDEQQYSDSEPDSDSEPETETELPITSRIPDDDNSIEDVDPDISDDDDDELLEDDGDAAGIELASSDEESDIEPDIEPDNEDEIQPKTKKTKKPKKQLMILDEEEDYEDDDEELNENYLEKFDSELVKNYIDEFHPECFHHNYDEIAKLSNVIRNSDGIIIDPLHKTIPYLTKYERTRVLGQRAKQIETGAKPFVKVPENIIEGYIIAELELKEKKIPFIIKRPIPGGACEYWKLNDLEVVHL